MRNKINLKTPSPHPSLLPRLNFTPDFLSLLPPSGAGGRRMGVTVNSSHVVSATPSSSGGGLLTLCPCSSVRSLPRETVLHQLLQCESFPQAAVLYKLLQCGSLPRGAVFPEQTAPAWVPHRVKSLASKPAPAWALLSVGLQVLPGACSSVGYPQGHSILRAHPLAPAWGPPWAAGGYLLHCGPPWAAGAQPVSP